MINAEWLNNLLLINSVATMLLAIYKDNRIADFLAIILMSISIASLTYLITKV